MRMIALILGWNLIALGLIAALSASLLHSVSHMVLAVLSLTTGLWLDLKFRKACLNRRDNPPKPRRKNRELDYY